MLEGGGGGGEKKFSMLMFSKKFFLGVGGAVSAKIFLADGVEFFFFGASCIYLIFCNLQKLKKHESYFLQTTKSQNYEFDFFQINPFPSTCTWGF